METQVKNNIQAFKELMNPKEKRRRVIADYYKASLDLAGFLGLIDSNKMLVLGESAEAYLIDDVLAPVLNFRLATTVSGATITDKKLVLNPGNGRYGAIVEVDGQAVLDNSRHFHWSPNARMENGSSFRVDHTRGSSGELRKISVIDLSDDKLPVSQIEASTVLIKKETKRRIDLKDKLTIQKDKKTSQGIVLESQEELNIVSGERVIGRKKNPELNESGDAIRILTKDPIKTVILIDAVSSDKNAHNATETLNLANVEIDDPPDVTLDKLDKEFNRNQIPAAVIVAKFENGQLKIVSRGDCPAIAVKEIGGKLIYYRLNRDEYLLKLAKKFNVNDDTITAAQLFIDSLPNANYLIPEIVGSKNEAKLIELLKKINCDRMDVLRFITGPLADHFMEAPTDSGGAIGVNDNSKLQAQTFTESQLQGVIGVIFVSDGLPKQLGGTIGFVNTFLGGNGNLEGDNLEKVFSPDFSGRRDDLSISVVALRAGKPVN